MKYEHQPPSHLSTAHEAHSVADVVHYWLKCILHSRQLCLTHQPFFNLRDVIQWIKWSVNTWANHKAEWKINKNHCITKIHTHGVHAYNTHLYTRCFSGVAQELATAVVLSKLCIVASDQNTWNMTRKFVSTEENQQRTWWAKCLT